MLMHMRMHMRMLISNVHKSIIVMFSPDTRFSKNVFEVVQKTRSTCFIGSKTTRLCLVVLNPINHSCLFFKHYLKLLSEKIIIPLLRLIFLNYMNQKLKLLWFQSLTTFCEERADNPILLVKNMLYSSQVRRDCSKAMWCTPTCESAGFEKFCLIVAFPF